MSVGEERGRRREREGNGEEEFMYMFIERDSMANLD